MALCRGHQLTCVGHNILSGVSQSLRARHPLTGDRSAHRAVDSLMYHILAYCGGRRGRARPTATHHVVGSAGYCDLNLDVPFHDVILNLIFTDLIQQKTFLS